ncbi:MAG: hypothetical protein NTY53_12870, partial [Kiritimatiellaeota bacterium]|nr:hypothetical protein [Kiritimatiellota bacterium]
MKWMMVCAVSLLAVLARAGEATLTVQVNQPGVKVSPLLYGIFFEEINRAGAVHLFIVIQVRQNDHIKPKSLG